MVTSMRKHLWIGFLLAGVCLFFAIRGISFQELAATLRRARMEWIAMALLVSTLGFLLRAKRWEILIKPIRASPARQLFWPMIIGFFANNVLPFRMGELVRAHLCGTKFQVSRTGSLGSIMLERLCDTISFLTIFLLVALLYPFPRYIE